MTEAKKSFVQKHKLNSQAAEKDSLRPLFKKRKSLEINEGKCSRNISHSGDTLNLNVAVLQNLGDNSQNPGFCKIPSVYRDTQMIMGIIENKDSGDSSLIYNRLKQNRTVPNRIDVVMNEILNTTSIMESYDNKEEDIVNDVSKVIEAVKRINSELSVNANEVYELLEANSLDDDRVNYVCQLILNQNLTSNSSTADDDIQILISSKQGSDEINGTLQDFKNVQPPVQCSVNEHRTKVCYDSSTQTKIPFHKQNFETDPLLLNDPIYMDMRTISKILPNKDQNDIYALLEAHHAKQNRVQVVIDELLHAGSNSQENNKSLDKNASRNMYTPALLHRELNELTSIFPNCDPNYIYENLEARQHDPDRVQKLAMELFEHKYPSLRDRLEKQKQMALKHQLSNMKFNMANFLSMFSDPFVLFEDEKKSMNENYQLHALIYLKNEFDVLKEGYLKKMLEKHNFHLSPSVAEIQKVQQKEFVEDGCDLLKICRACPREEEIQLPDKPDELFYHECLFIKHKEEISEFLTERTKQKDRRRELSKKNGELLECSCCFEDECLFEDMLACADGHLFCKDCVKRSSEIAIGENKVRFLCLTQNCEEEFSLSSIQSVLSVSMFSNLLRKLQAEEVKQANIQDLVCCPFCSFATIMPNQDDKVFMCLNPECLKESCRLCKEPNHIPLRCSEVEQQGELNMRKYLELKMTEAMLRTCWKCKNRFYKESGCNMMTCTCGATMCYVCRKPRVNHGHFLSGCSLEMDPQVLHEKEMKKALAEARKTYADQHSEMKNVTLKYDPINHLQKRRNSSQSINSESDSTHSDYDYDHC